MVKTRPELRIFVPPDKIRAVNLAIARRAWGGFRTEFYLTYDFRPINEELRSRGMQALAVHPLPDERGPAFLPQSAMCGGRKSVLTFSDHFDFFYSSSCSAGHGLNQCSRRDRP